MRYSREHKLETHARIVKKASVRLREKGAHGIGVADLMKDAGLTHGGFYAHFDSREALVMEAFAHAMDRSTERWRKLAEQTPPEKRLATIVSSYLTAAHRDDPAAAALDSAARSVLISSAVSGFMTCDTERRDTRDETRRPPRSGTVISYVGRCLRNLESGAGAMDVRGEREGCSS